MYVCSECGHESVKWQGQCESCKSWNTMKEFHEPKITQDATGQAQELKKISDNVAEDQKRILSKSEELNTLLGGGMVPGSVILLSGEPGIGKSTLTLQLADWIKEDMIYISGEETEYQLSDRANRLGIETNNLSILSESCIENILETLKKNTAKILVIDSISVMHSNQITGTSGSIAQVRYITEILVHYAKTTGTCVYIIGHINKDGNLAGPKTLEHMVDTVLYFEGDKFDNLRMLRGLKNRFGPTSEIALFSMGEKGLQDMRNPGIEFIQGSEPSVGSSLSVTIEGSRALIIETESLTTYTKFGYPKRSARGINTSKLDLIIAVLGKYTSISLDSYDVYSNISRGLKIEEPGIDLSLAASIISSKSNKPLPKDTLFVGEISLTGKLKKPIQLEKRITEAEKLGFKKIILPKTKITQKHDIEILQIDHISELQKNLQI
ncbi:DNA repair protein RadA [Candidatus Gracilibacteria bacterium]|nr:DNA repair protein RadA [Candidatus Gracilibacteria bacterium]